MKNTSKILYSPSMMGGNSRGELDDGVIRMECQGSSGGSEWDHGAYTGVRKVSVSYIFNWITQIEVDYDKAGEVETRGSEIKGENWYPKSHHVELVLDYPNEYITSVVVTYDLEAFGLNNRVKSLSFKTSKERMFPTYRELGSQTFVLESKGRALVGFHGRSSRSTLNAIGAYFGPPPPHVEKLGKGGDRGALWDAGAFDSVRKIYVGHGQNGVASVKFVYDQNDQVVVGEDHGKKTVLGYEEFELEYPNEYITAVEGCYDKISGNEFTVITMLKFKTNLRTSPAFGVDSTSSFVLEKEGHKIVGFHGQSSHELHQLGANVTLIFGFNKIRGDVMANSNLSDCLEMTFHRFAAMSPELKTVFSEMHFIQYYSSFFDANVKPFSELLGQLKISWRAIAKVLADADHKAHDVEEVKRWLTKFQDASFQAENIIEDILEVSGRCILFPQSPRIWMSNWNLTNNLREEMEGVVCRLEHLVGQITVLGLRDCGRSTEGQSKPRPHMSSLSYGRYFGRDADKLAFTKLLLSDDIASRGTLNVISVNGMQGIGKTTLVEVIYNDESMARHFNLKVWIYVGQDFDVFRVTKDVLHQITSAEAKTENLRSLQVQLMETLQGKRFLLVLDDFWSERSEDWNLFLTAFTGGSKGSKIVLTTQSQIVTSITQAARTYQLKLMTDTECWELICSSFCEYNSVNSISEELERVGKKIAEQCKGLPLAASTIASHLRTKKDHLEWYDVSNNFLHYTTGVLEVFRRSYDSLPCHLKRCFAFCSIFPKGYEFDRKSLVLLWMALDLLYQPGSNQRLEDIGNKYLDELVSRSFLLTLDSKKRFTMHDLMNDFAVTVAGELCFRLEDENLVQKIPERVRHLSLCGKQYDSLVVSGVEYLRTFLPLVVSPSSVLDPLPNFSEKALRSLRILSLSHYTLSKVPESFMGLKHLRYLDLSNTDVKDIPEFVFILRNLQTLLLSNCRRLRRLAEDIKQLINLRHLVLKDTALVEMPQVISKLISLQRLSNFVIGKLSGAGLQELRELIHLRGTLHISELQNVVSLTEASDPGLKEKPLLKKLVLTWSSVETSGSNTVACDQIEVLKMLQPHPYLEKVSIDSYGGATFPNWLGDTSFICMTSVSLSSCNLCTSMPPLGQLPHLRSLSIEKFKILQEVGFEFFYGEKGNSSSLQPFPYLQNLSFYDMPRWEEWRCPKVEGRIFPRLNKLTITCCPGLKNLPKDLPDFTHVTISDSASTCEEDSGKILEPPYLSKHKELYMPDQPESSSQNYEDIAVASEPYQKRDGLWEDDVTTLSSDDGSTSEEMMSQQDEDEDDTGFESFKATKVHELEKLPANLKRLHIEGCPGLEFLPESLFQDCPNLQELLVVVCRSLEAFTFPEGYPSSPLKTLYIRDCMKLELGESFIFQELEDLVIDSSCSTLYSFPLALFPKLKSLSIRHCETFSSFSVTLDRGDVGLALESLEITDCPYLEQFPKEGLGTLKLTSMLISKCRNLKGLPADLSTFTSLLSIHVNECPELRGIPDGGLPKSLMTLCISRCQNFRPKVEWLMSRLGNLRDLEIDGGNDDDTVSFPDKDLLPRSLYSLRIRDFKNLQTLNYEGTEGLRALGILEISGCDKLASLPDEGLPSSLSFLRINGCPVLKDKISKRDMEWFNIKDIQLVEIDGEQLLRGRKKN